MLLLYDLLVYAAVAVVAAITAALVTYTIVLYEIERTPNYDPSGPPPGDSRDFFGPNWHGASEADPE